mmetsp:Transcript_98969/g.206281  ORF Transcript_98969/g.206281 Transcript_98969/m.206281 type:complete len:241 (-) Transcript_98969:3971-4693(-)
MCEATELAPDQLWRNLQKLQDTFVRLLLVAGLLRLRLAAARGTGRFRSFVLRVATFGCRGRGSCFLRSCCGCLPPLQVPQSLQSFQIAIAQLGASIRKGSDDCLCVGPMCPHQSSDLRRGLARFVQVSDGSRAEQLLCRIRVVAQRRQLQQSRSMCLGHRCRFGKRTPASRARSSIRAFGAPTAQAALAVEGVAAGLQLHHRGLLARLAQANDAALVLGDVGVSALPEHLSESKRLQISQ